MMFMKSLRHRLTKSTALSAVTLEARSTKNIDVAIIGGRGYHSSYGGVENAIRQISNHMAASYSIQIMVYGTDSSEVDGSKLSNTDLSCVYSPHSIYSRLGQHGAVFACVLHALFISRPRTVLIFASGPSVFVPLFRVFGKPVITSLRAIDSARDKWGKISRKILQTGEYFAWRYSTTLTANSMEMINTYKARRSDAVFVPNGSLPALDGVSRIRQEFNLADNGYFLFAARLDPAKRLHLLLQAHAQLPEEQRLPLVIAGGHSKSEKYQQSLMQYAGPDVIFLGHITAEQLDPLMVHCRAFVLPSVLEGMSNSLLTAMATGCAVLASDIPPNADVLQNDDAIFKADDLMALQLGLQRLSCAPDFAVQLGQKLKQHAQSTYSWQRTGELFYAQIEPHLARVTTDG